MGIKDLGGKSCQVFGFKGVRGKVFIKHRVTMSNCLENEFGAASRPVLGTATPLNCPNVLIIAAG
jgi:hypothetical protein